MAVRLRRLFSGRTLKYLIAIVFVTLAVGAQVWGFVVTGRLRVYNGHFATFAQEPLGFTITGLLTVLVMAYNVILIRTMIRDAGRYLSEPAEGGADLPPPGLD